MPARIVVVREERRLVALNAAPRRFVAIQGVRGAPGPGPQVRDAEGNLLGTFGVVLLSQAEYDAIPDPDPHTLYLIS